MVWPVAGAGLSAAARFAAKRAAKKAVAKGIKRKTTAQAAAKKAIKNKKESLHHSDLSPDMKRDVNFIKDHGHKAKYVIQKGLIFCVRKMSNTITRYSIHTTTHYITHSCFWMRQK